MFKIILNGKHFVETKKHDKHLIFSRTELSAIIHNLFSFRMALHMMLYRNVTALVFPDFLQKNILMDDGNMLYALLLWQILQYSLIIIQLSNFWSINLIWSMNSKTVEHCKRHSWWYSSKFDVWILWPLANSTLNLTVQVLRMSFFLW